MIGKTYLYQQKIAELTEREKELKCLYRVEELISKNLAEEDFFYELLKRIPYGWQHPGICRARVVFSSKVYAEPGWSVTDHCQKADIEIDERIYGQIEVYYLASQRLQGQPQFLPEEQKLLNSIAHRVGVYLFRRKLENSLALLREKAARKDDLVTDSLGGDHDAHWKWRYRMAEVITGRLDFQAYRIKGVYLIGSSKEANAGPASDIDLLVHVDDESDRLDLLKAWIEGWSLCLSEVNFSRTGYMTDGLVDLHVVTDEDIRNKTSYAVMIGAHTNSAKPLKTIP